MATPQRSRSGAPPTTTRAALCRDSSAPDIIGAGAPRVNSTRTGSSGPDETQAGPGHIQRARAAPDTGRAGTGRRSRECAAAQAEAKRVSCGSHSVMAAHGRRCLQCRQISLCRCTFISRSAQHRSQTLQNNCSSRLFTTPIGCGTCRHQQLSMSLRPLRAATANAAARLQQMSWCTRLLQPDESPPAGQLRLGIPATTALLPFHMRGHSHTGIPLYSCPFSKDGRHAKEGVIGVPRALLPQPQATVLLLFTPSLARLPSSSAAAAAGRATNRS